MCLHFADAAAGPPAGTLCPQPQPPPISIILGKPLTPVEPTYTHTDKHEIATWLTTTMHEVSYYNACITALV